MINSILLQLVLAGNANALLAPLPIQRVTSTTTFYNTSLPNSDSLLAYTKSESPKSEQNPGEDNTGENDKKNHSKDAAPLDKKRVSDLSPTEPKPLGLLAVDGEGSLHPEHDPQSSSYSGRRAPGPDHGDDPHGSDPHDEIHDSGLPANEGKNGNHPKGKYYPSKRIPTVTQFQISNLVNLFWRHAGAYRIGSDAIDQ